MARGRRPDTILSPGMVFGRWTILGEDPVRTTNRQVKYFVKCSCGFETSVQGAEMRKGRSLGCSGCQQKDRALSQLIHASTEHIPGFYMRRLENTAHRRNISVDLTIQDLEDQWVLQSGRCALTGKPLTLKVVSSGTGDASVDRIDSKVGYVPGNIQWVNKTLNQAKMDLPEEEFFQLCRDVVNHKEYTKALRSKGTYKPWLLKSAEELWNE